MPASQTLNLSNNLSVYSLKIKVIFSSLDYACRKENSRKQVPNYESYKQKL